MINKRQCPSMWWRRWWEDWTHLWELCRPSTVVLAAYDRDHLPGLPGEAQDFLCSLQGRRWLWRMREGNAIYEMIEARFGQDIAEAAQLWVALQEDMNNEVKNVADIPMAGKGAESAAEEAP